MGECLSLSLFSGSDREYELSECGMRVIACEHCDQFYRNRSLRIFFTDLTNHQTQVLPCVTGRINTQISPNRFAVAAKHFRLLCQIFLSH